MTSQDNIPAVIAGLAVGIGFVVVFSLLSAPSLIDSGNSSAAVTGETGQEILIDFSIGLAERDMIVKTGEILRAPITIESRGSAERMLSLSIRYAADLPDAGELVLSLDTESVVLSEDNIAQGEAWINEHGWMITDAGFLIITASPEATVGTYEYIIEANWDGEPGGVGMGSGQLFTVTVVDSDGEHPGIGEENSTSQKITSVKVAVGGEPKESTAQSGMDSSLQTRYLPVNITHAIELSQPTRNVTILPVLADWDGIVSPEVGMYSLMQDQNHDPVTFEGFGTLSLHGVRATCTEPRHVRVLENENDGMQLEDSSAPVQSTIYWGDTVEVSFDKAQSGFLYYTMAGYGIVPHEYNDKNDETYRTNGAGNQEISGTYHLSFPSFYQAEISLPPTASVNSFSEIKCSVDEDSTHVSKSEYPRIYFYDVWFVM